MADPHHDYLFDPAAPPDPAVVQLERTLKPHRSNARGLQWTATVTPHRSMGRRWILGTLAAASVAFAIVALLEFRLTWPAGAAWDVDRSSTQARTQLGVGEHIETSASERVTIRTARIGEVMLAEGSSLRLLDTRSGRHRVELEHGRLRAKVWAPPGQFGVRVGNAVIVDLGCEFELSADASGNGTVTVLSGWVSYNGGSRELLIPAGFGSTFSGTTIETPLRSDASTDFRRSMQALDALLVLGAGQAEIDSAALSAARSASRMDVFSLLSVLTRHRELARGVLYERLHAELESGPIDEVHRSLWLQGDNAAIDRWWHTLPRQPKSWWRNWRDAW